MLIIVYPARASHRGRPACRRRSRSACCNTHPGWLSAMPLEMVTPPGAVRSRTWRAHAWCGVRWRPPSRRPSAGRRSSGPWNRQMWPAVINTQSAPQERSARRKKWRLCSHSREGQGLAEHESRPADRHLDADLLPSRVDQHVAIGPAKERSAATRLEDSRPPPTSCPARPRRRCGTLAPAGAGV